MATLPLKVNDLRKELLALGAPEIEVAAATRDKLKEMYTELTADKPVTANNFGIVFEEQEKPITAEAANDTMGKKLPKYGSAEWQSYILSLLEPNEQLDGFPRCFGLRRVAQLVLGPIMSAKAAMVSVIPTSDSRAVTISYEITFDWQLDRSVWLNPNNTQLSDYRTFGGVADCVEDTGSAWGKNPAASAESKAMSRALKQALCLNVLSAEEKVSGYDEGPKEASGSSNITSQLVSFIEAKATALSLDIRQIVKDYGFSVTNIKDLTLEEGRKLFAHINTFQQEKPK